MIILIQGKDAYRRKSVIQKLMTEHSDKNRKLKVSFFEFNPKSVDFTPLIDEVKQTSIFKEKKFLIVTNLLERFGASKEIISFLNHFVDSSEIIIILTEIKPIPKKQSLAQLFNKIYDADFLKFNLLEEWALNEISLRGGKIEKRALGKLIDIIENDLWALSNEIDKLISYRKGEMILFSDIILLVKPKIESNIFKAIDFMAIKNKKEALKMIYSHLGKGDAIPYLLSMIGFQFRNLILVKNSDSHSIGAKDLGMHPFVFKKVSSQSHCFSKKELERIYQNIVASDIGIKTGKIEPKMALDLLIFQI